MTSASHPGAAGYLARHLESEQREDAKRSRKDLEEPGTRDGGAFAPAGRPTGPGQLTYPPRPRACLRSLLEPPLARSLTQRMKRRGRDAHRREKKARSARRLLLALLAAEELNALGGRRRAI